MIAEILVFAFLLLLLLLLLIQTFRLEMRNVDIEMLKIEKRHLRDDKAFLETLNDQLAAENIKLKGEPYYEDE